MEKFKTIYLAKLDDLKNILQHGEKLGIDFSELILKIDSVKGSLKDNKIRIVLLSSFSEGKTSTIAGLIGKIEGNMKIDNDESSDEIVIYRPTGMAEGFEFVDTPGLFGSKEKEIEGKCVRFSEITEKYLSESHLILFICDAVNPLKESHAYIIEQLMRKYKKLDSTIFVINKMDQASVDLADERDFARGAEIKKANLIQRLRDTINLTPEEEKKINIVCIAADPDGEGIEKWLESIDEYKQYSHIEELKEKVNEVISTSDKSHLQIETTNASIIEITSSVSYMIKDYAQRLSTALAISKEASECISTDLDLLKKDLRQNRNDMTTRLTELQNSILDSINGASVDTINSILEKEIGVEGNDITFYIFNRKLNQIIMECSEANDISIRTRAENISKQTSIQEKVISTVAKGASEALQKVNISGETVKSIRNAVAKNYKFAPWGAIKLGDKATKVIKAGGKGIGIGLEIYKFYKAWRNENNLQKMKDSLKSDIQKQLAEIFRSFNTDNDYYENYASSFIELQREAEKRQIDCSRLEDEAIKLREYGNSLTNWAIVNAKDAIIINEE